MSSSIFRSFAAANPKTVAIHFLGALVEHGRKAARDGFLGTDTEFQAEIERHLKVVTEANLLESPDFLLSLRLGILRATERFRDKWGEELLINLAEIFPEAFARRLHEVAIGKAREDVKAERNLVPAESVRAAYYQRRHAVLTALATPIRRRS